MSMITAQKVWVALAILASLAGAAIEGYSQGLVGGIAGAMIYPTALLSGTALLVVLYKAIKFVFS